MASHQWQKFVAATDTVPTPADSDVKSSSVTVSTVSAEPQQKDEIDMKLQDFLAVSWVDVYHHNNN